MTDHKPLPVAGYTPQGDDKIAQVNTNKRLEEAVLSRLDEIAAMEGIDKRWLAIGRTHVEEGFMSINRAIFKPQRIGGSK